MGRHGTLKATGGFEDAALAPKEQPGAGHVLSRNSPVSWLSMLAHDPTCAQDVKDRQAHKVLEENRSRGWSPSV